VRNVTDRLHELFGNQVVSLNRPVEWPPRSPDLTPCDFFLWGYVKSRVFSSPCPNIMALRQKILDEFILLQNNRDLITRAVRAMGSRAQLCIERNGGHVEGRFG